jgi:hypothetical protein
MICQATQAQQHTAKVNQQQGQVARYHHALAKGRRGQLWAGLTGRSRGLLSLEEIPTSCTVQARRSGETRTVAIAQIRGSENRVADFDCDFNPLQDHTCERWLGIAAARQRGSYLPPVALIQVGDLYFVRDGHHRISVARALGQQAIEATVEVWQVDAALPWERLPQAPSRECALDRASSRAASILGWLSGLLRAPDAVAASQNAR